MRVVAQFSGRIMSTDRITRVNELLRREIGQALFHIMNNTPDFDLSAVTITRVESSRDLRHARVLVSIRNHHAQRQSMMGLLRKHRVEIQSLISKNLILKYTPRLLFEQDPSLEKGDRILSLLYELDTERHEGENGQVDG